MDQRLDFGLKIGIKQTKKYIFTLIFFLNKANMFDFSKQKAMDN